MSSETSDLHFKTYFLGAFAKLRKATISFVMSVRLSVRMEQLGSHWTNFHVWVFFENLSGIFRFHWNRKRVLYVKINIHFFIISRSVLLRMRNLSDKRCRENQNAHFVSSNFFWKSCRLWENVEKYCRRGQATDDNTAHSHCMLVT
jgi:hypothetical protein